MEAENISILEIEKLKEQRDELLQLCKWSLASMGYENTTLKEALKKAILEEGQ